MICESPAACLAVLAICCVYNDGGPFVLTALRASSVDTHAFVDIKGYQLHRYMSMSAWQKFISNKSAEELDQYRAERREYNRNYQEANKDKIHERVAPNLVPHVCEVCGQQYSAHNSTRHLQSKRHRRAMGEDIPNKKKSATGPRTGNNSL